MKKLLFICFFSQLIFAQNIENIDLIEENGENRIIIELRFDNPLDAIELQLSPRVPVVLESVQRGDNTVWLKRSDKNIDNDNVIGWFKTDSSLVVHNNANVLANGLITLQLSTDSKKIMRVNLLSIQLRQFVLQDEQWRPFTDQQAVTKIFPLRKKDAN